MYILGISSGYSCVKLFVDLFGYLFILVYLFGVDRIKSLYISAGISVFYSCIHMNNIVRIQILYTRRACACCLQKTGQSRKILCRVENITVHRSVIKYLCFICKRASSMEAL